MQQGWHQYDSQIHLASCEGDTKMTHKLIVQTARMTPRCLVRSSCRLLGWHKDYSKIHALCCYGDTKMPQKFMLRFAGVTPRWLKSLCFMWQGWQQDDSKIQFWQMLPFPIENFCLGFCILLAAYWNFWLDLVRKLRPIPTFWVFFYFWLEIRCLSESRICGFPVFFDFFKISKGF